jgi:hypothetical protein
MQRRLQTVLFGVTLIALVSLCASYGRLIRNVELAATEAGIVDGPAVR